MRRAHATSGDTLSARRSGLTAAVGLALLIAAVSGLGRHRHVVADFGSTSAPSGAARDEPIGVHAQPAVPSQRAVPSQLALPSPPTARSRPTVPSPPVTLEIPALRVRATVIPVLTSDGELDVPDDPAQVGWWTRSAMPGAASGSVVIDGHVDAAATGPGALFRLTDLRAGEQVIVTTATSDRRNYLVTGRRVYVKTAGLPPDLLAPNNAPRLVLITCGGPFDHATGSYLDNIVVFAAPA